MTAGKKINHRHAYESFNTLGSFVDGIINDATITNGRFRLMPNV